MKHWGAKAGEELTQGALLADSQDGCGLERADGGRDKGSSGDEGSGKHVDRCVVFLKRMLVNASKAERRKRASNLEGICWWD